MSQSEQVVPLEQMVQQYQVEQVIHQVLLVQ
jgi:hypothetical protein